MNNELVAAGVGYTNIGLIYSYIASILISAQMTSNIVNTLWKHFVVCFICILFPRISWFFDNWLYRMLHICTFCFGGI